MRDDRLALLINRHGYVNDIDPEAYLRHILERIAEHPINNIDALLPWNITDALKNPAKLAP